MPHLPTATKQSLLSNILYNQRDHAVIDYRMLLETKRLLHQ